MEDMIYYTEADVALEDVAECVQRAGYKTQLYTFEDEIHLNILYDSKYQGDNFQAYCRWNTSSNDVSLLEEEEQSALRRLNLRPTTRMWIQYMLTTLPDLTPILKSVLSCYGGYIRCEYGFYNFDNIDELGTVVI